MAGAVLILESSPNSGLCLSEWLSDQGFDAKGVPSVSAALTELAARHYAVVVLDSDVAAPASQLSLVLQDFKDVPVVAAVSGVKRAIEAMRAGAADALERPIQNAELLSALERVLARAAREPAPPPPCVTPDSTLLGDSRTIVHVLDVIRRVAPSDATVLVRGETGTGKELAARAIHGRSARARGPFVKVHCAGLPETLLESELFGYEKGAFTGATARKPGRVEVAEGGTLFLDEIGDVTPAMQVKLLRLLQDREYERLGGASTIRADVRFIAATHRDLEHMIATGEFREDLFYRLNVVPIWLPPLRARRSDVPFLARHFCDAFARTHGKPELCLTDGAVSALSCERWPGNVRQLQNFMERLVVLAETGTIEKADVLREMAAPLPFPTQSFTGAASENERVKNGDSPSLVVPLDAALRDAETSAIERALRIAKGNRTLAARLLGIGRATLYTKIDELGLGRKP